MENTSWKCSLAEPWEPTCTPAVAKKLWRLLQSPDANSFRFGATYRKYETIFLPAGFVQLRALIGGKWQLRYILLTAQGDFDGFGIWCEVTDAFVQWYLSAWAYRMILACVKKGHAKKVARGSSDSDADDWMKVNELYLFDAYLTTLDFEKIRPRSDGTIECPTKRKGTPQFLVPFYDEDFIARAIQGDSHKFPAGVMEIQIAEMRSEQSVAWCMLFQGVPPLAMLPTRPIHTNMLNHSHRSRID